MVSPYDKTSNMDEKKKIATVASTFVRNNMVIGLGSGSTMELFLEQLQHRIVLENLRLSFIASSKKIEQKAREHGLTLLEIHEVTAIDQAFDGADRIDEGGNLIKGGGGSLFREKQVLLKAKERYILVDSSKYVKSFSNQIIPVEIVPFNADFTLMQIENLGYKSNIRTDGTTCFTTDNGNWIVDIAREIPGRLEHTYNQLKLISGVVEVGVFLNNNYKIVKTF